MWYRKQEIIKMDKQIERAGDDNKNNIGVLYGIGVGPGDPELMTLKAINTIKACDIIAIPAVSKEECYVYGIVPSFCAAAARLGISLGEMMDEIHIIPASYDVRDTLGLRWNLCIHEIRKEACRAYRGASHRRCYQKKENDSVWCDKLWHGV